MLLQSSVAHQSGTFQFMVLDVVHGGKHLYAAFVLGDLAQAKVSAPFFKHLCLHQVI